MSCCGRASVVGADDILRHCAAALPAFKTPKQIVLSDELPKTERGKLDRKALVERWTRHTELFTVPSSCGSRVTSRSELDQGSALNLIADHSPSRWCLRLGQLSARAGKTVRRIAEDQACSPLAALWQRLDNLKENITGEFAWQALRAAHRCAAATIATVMFDAARGHRCHARRAYPTAPVKVVVPFGAGGATDILARVFADRLQQHLGQPFTVENRGGAAGQIAATAVARSPADGSTLMFTTAAPITIAPLMNDKVQYDPRKDFVPIAVVAVMPVWLVVNANSPLQVGRRHRHQSQGQSRQAQLRHLRRRHRAASRGRGVVPLGWHPDACMCRSAAAAR